jgi:hypothetical protein
VASKHWIGGAPAVAQLAEASIDSLDGTPANNSFSVDIGTVSVTVLGTSNPNQTAGALVTALQAATHPYYTAITWSNPSGSTVRAVALVPGAPFVAALTVSGPGTGTVTDFADTVASSGPNDWSTAANWSDGAIPAAGDTVLIGDSQINLAWGLDNAGLDFARLTIEDSYIGRLGLDRTAFATSADAVTTNPLAVEYREDYLRADIELVRIGVRSGLANAPASPRIKIDNTRADASATYVLAAAPSIDDPLPAVRLLMADAGAKLYVSGARGGVGVAVEPGETAELLEISHDPPRPTDVLATGAGCTLQSYRQSGGDAVLQAADPINQVKVDGGTLLTLGDFEVTNAEARRSCVWVASHSGGAGDAFGTLRILQGGTVDLNRIGGARTINELRIDRGTLIVSDEVITVTTWQLPRDLRTVTVA